MATVIDALIVTLKLDPTQFKQATDQAKKSQDALKSALEQGTKSTDVTAKKAGNVAKLEAAEKKKRDDDERKRRRLRDKEERSSHDAEKKRSEETISNLKSIGLAAAGAILGFNSVKGAIQAYASATSQLAALGRFAPTVGSDVKTLDKLGDAYKQVGSSAEEAGSDIAKIAHAQFSYAMGAPDAMAGWMRRLGVSAFDANNNPREKEAVEQDIAKAIKSRTGDLQTQAMYAREMGMSEGFIQLYLVKSAEARAKILSDAEKTAVATEAGAKSAIAQEQATARLKNNMKAVGENVVKNVAPSITGVANILADLMEGDTTSAKKELGFGRKYGAAATAQFDPRAAPFLGLFEAAENKYDLPKGSLAAIAKQESQFNPNAVAKNKKTGAVTGKGMMQLNPKYFPSAGKSVSKDVDAAGKEFARLLAHYRGVTDDPAAALQLAIAAYNGGQGNIDSLVRGGDPYKNGGHVSKETQGYVPLVSKYAGFSANATAPTAGAATGSGGGASTTNITTRVDKVEVHTAATDAKGIVADIGPEMQRQGVVSQANTGMN